MAICEQKKEEIDLAVSVQILNMSQIYNKNNNNKEIFWKIGQDKSQA